MSTCDLLIRNATLPDGRTGIDVLVARRPHRRRRRRALRRPTAATTVDARGLAAVAAVRRRALPHGRDAVATACRASTQSGTLLEGIALWGELKPQLTQDAIVERALAYCDWAVAKGLLAIRSHVDVCDAAAARGRGAAARASEQVKPYLDLQLVAFPQDGVLRTPGALANLKRALRLGVDVVGGIPHFERTMADGAESVRVLCELAAERGLPRRHALRRDRRPACRATSRRWRSQTQRLGLQGRVTGSHLTSMHSMDNYYVSQADPADRRGAACSAVANPLINITLQGRHDTYPKRRGMTRVPELMAAGVNVALRPRLRDGPVVLARPRRHARGRADGPARRADDRARTAMRACFDAVTVERRRRSWTSTATASRRATAPTSCCCRRAIPVEAIRLRATAARGVARGESDRAHAGERRRRCHCPGGRIGGGLDAAAMSACHPGERPLLSGKIHGHADKWLSLRVKVGI